MGTAPSKSSGDGVAFQNSAVPIQFSNPLVSKLEDPKTASGHDGSSIEALIQQRVAEELKRLKAAERESFTQTTLDVSADPSSSSSTGADKDDLNAIILQREIDALKAQVKKRSSSSDSSSSPNNPSSDSTKSNEATQTSSASSPTAAVSSLLSSSRTTTASTTGSAEKARDAVITCLRKNSGRSLDCRVEVLDFKKAVAELQKGFVERYQ